MTAAEAGVLGSKDAPECAHQMPLHNAPSLHDLMALKRQRRSLDEAITPQPQPSSQDAPESERPAPAADADASEPGQGSQNAEPAVEASEAPGKNGFLTAPTFALPLLPSVPGEPMSGYFQRLRGSLAGSHPHPPPPDLLMVTSLQQDGLYLHKRPIRGPNGSSPLAVCGSVLHHVLVLAKQGPLLHSLDFGPANGADVTANILEQAPPKKVWTTTTTTTATDNSEAAATDAAHAAVATASGPVLDQELPYMFLGAPAVGVDHPLVQELVTWAEARPYHALTNNCIHFADALVRLMTAGAVRSAPLLYDLKCGAVPAVDNPMLLMMQLMLRMPWFVVVDGSPLTAAFLEHCRTGVRGQDSAPAPGNARVGADKPEAAVDRDGGEGGVVRAMSEGAVPATPAPGGDDLPAQREELEELGQGQGRGQVREDESVRLRKFEEVKA